MNDKRRAKAVVVVLSPGLNQPAERDARRSRGVTPQQPVVKESAGQDRGS